MRIVRHWLFVPACVGVAATIFELAKCGLVAAGAIAVLFLTVFGLLWWGSR